MSSLQLLHMPWRDRQIIEASAGTGKTWTLAALYLRLVLGHGRPEGQGLQPAQILVMTFTEAATAELRERIRDRLHHAAVWFDQRIAQTVSASDTLLQDLSASIPADQWPRCAAQLHQAAQNMDEAAIFTIHAWSRRMLGSYALHSRDLFEQTHLDNPEVLLSQLLHDHWRRWFYPLPLAAQQALKQHLGGQPEQMLPELKKRWQELDRRPPNPEQARTEPVPPAEVLAPYVVWQARLDKLVEEARQAWHSDMAQTLLEARKAGLIRGSGITNHNFLKWVTALQAWAERGEDIKPDTLRRFSTSLLQDRGWAQAADHPVFAHIEAIDQQQGLEPPCKTPLLDHAAQEVRQRYEQAKQQQSRFDFQDLLQRLHTALHADDGQMAAAIRAQYPVAMVDEFQDTDPWQYDSLDRIYHPDAVDQHNALVMIGDPKQAIYSFRGADLSTYIRARDSAIKRNPHALHTLDSNFRSTRGLVDAVNHVFSQVTQPFHSTSGRIDFEKVHSRSTAQALHDAQGQALTPFTVWLLGDPPDSDTAQWNAQQHVQHMAQGFAAQMVTLLNTHEDIQPGDMAVLVRTQVQAKAMQSALHQVGLPSVYLSDHANVYQSDEAQDLWRVLRAISAPRQSAWLRSALAARIWGLTMPDLQALLHNEAQADALVESCQRWRQQWQQQGVLPMLYSWVHEQGIATRLLREPQGERRLTNLLHLGELLQHASQSLQGPQALLQHLVQQMQHSSDSPEAQKTRLETDAQCVQIVTYHKSKGLEYPLVFVPFLSSFKAGPQNKHDEDEGADITESSVDEDMRLLYVALTRAKRGLWLGLANTASNLSGSGSTLKLSAVSQLLQRQSHSDLRQQVQALWGSSPDIAIDTLPPPSGQRHTARHHTALDQTALTPTRGAHPRWWTASFSSLTRGLEAGTEREEAFMDAHNDAMPLEAPLGEDQQAANSSVDPSSAWQSFPAGARYGSLLHDLLEWQALNAWPLAQAPSPNNAWTQAAWQDLLQRKTDWLQLRGDEQAQITPWLKSVIATTLPLTAADDASHVLASPLCLQQLTPQQMWPEMDFSLCAGRVASGDLDALIQQHVLPGQARPALQHQVMQGMLTGFMDLVVEHDGRYWVLDYKSNKLDQYQAPALQSAVLAKRYEVQYVLYILAVHRLLKNRLSGYHYEQHMGGAVYLFLRGIDDPGAGVHALRPPWVLIDQLDQLLAQVPA